MSPGAGHMALALTLHYDNALHLPAPRLEVRFAGAPAPEVIAASGDDAFGLVYRAELARSEFRFRFVAGSGAPGADPARAFRPFRTLDRRAEADEVWCSGHHAFLYPVAPRAAEARSAPEVLGALPWKPGAYVPASGGLSGLGAHVLADGRVSFGLYHPTAARVWVVGSFNDWQWPGHEAPEPARFLECARHRGWFGAANTWLAVSDRARAGDEYKFAIAGGVPRDGHGRLTRVATDPYARQLGPHTGFNNAVIADPTGYAWGDDTWRTPDVGALVLYELSVYGFTEGDGDVEPALHGRFAGVAERVRRGYFATLGANALSLMPLAEVPSPQGPRSLGYDPSLYGAVERDFGEPDDLRALVDAAHQAGVAVLIDQVFNHTSNDFNPLWGLILEDPAEEADPREGGLYFNGATDWGNRVATEKLDVQSLLIDACAQSIVEYHVDGFRFDATHSRWMDHGFLRRLAAELRRLKPDVVLIAENLPNEADLDLEGWNGFAQWSDPFHDTIKALLREGPFGDTPPDAERLAGVMYFSRAHFAGHTNNTVNYSESHDETSIPFEVGTNPLLAHPAAKDRKGRLGLFTALVALGQPMLYMGQEFNVERDRNEVSFRWPSPPESSGFFQWTRRVIHLRRRYPGLRLTGFDPAGDGRLAWILGPWMDERHGGGRRVAGWRARPGPDAHEAMVVLLNFEGHEVLVDLELGLPGIWVKLADMDRVDDIAPAGGNGASDPTALRSADGRFGGFALPPSSGFVYKWEAPG